MGEPIPMGEFVRIPDYIAIGVLIVLFVWAVAASMLVGADERRVARLKTNRAKRLPNQKTTPPLFTMPLTIRR
jgi:hypothetical protein